MTPRQRRMTLVLGIVAGVSIAGALALNAFRQNVMFYFDPTKVANGQVKVGERFRLGGMVTQGSVKRVPGSLEVHFVVTDFNRNVPVSYTGVLPDLFREGTGVVAHGKLRPDGTFVADEVLAKHDEKYMPPEVARSLKRRHGESRADATGPAEEGATQRPAEPQSPSAQAPATMASPRTPSALAPTAIQGAPAPSAQAGAASQTSLAPSAQSNTAVQGPQPSSPRTADTARTQQPPTARAATSPEGT